MCERERKLTEQYSVYMLLPLFSRHTQAQCYFEFSPSVGEDRKGIEQKANYTSQNAVSEHGRKAGHAWQVAQSTEQMIWPTTHNLQRRQANSKECVVCVLSSCCVIENASFSDWCKKYSKQRVLS